VEKVSTFTAFYDLAVGPVSFDFAVFLVKAEMARRRAGAKRLHVVVVPFAGGLGGAFRDKGHFYDEHESRWRLWNIVLPCCSLMGASVTLAADWPQACAIHNHAGHQAGRLDWVFPDDWDSQTLKNRRHLIGDVIAWSRRGEAVPRLEASTHARRNVRAFYATLGAPVVTMTLRKTYLPARNSDADEWRKAAAHIETRGYTVLHICDTGSALAAGGGYGELNLDVRMACYQEAALNLQANNGAASLCWFSQAPYRMFGANVPAEEWDGLFVKQGLAIGQSWPWASPGQKIVYGRENADVIVKEFEAWAGATS
jgi:hypothetical protein